MKSVFLALLFLIYSAQAFAKNGDQIEKANQFFKNTMNLSTVTSIYFGSDNFVTKDHFKNLENEFAKSLNTKDKSLSLANCNVCGKPSNNLKENIEILNCTSLCKVYVSQYLGYLTGAESNSKNDAAECVDSVNGTGRNKSKTINLNLPVQPDSGSSSIKK